MSSKVRVYALGGAGTNVAASRLASIANTKQDGFAELEITYVDTADSNLNERIPRESVVMIGENKGSGKIRGENAQAIIDAVPQITNAHKPTEHNIIISSLSGGSGSTLTNALTHEIMQKFGKNVIVLGIASPATGRELKNTIDTLNNLDLIAQNVKRPIGLAYYENDPTKTTTHIDDNIKAMVMMLQVVLSTQNRGLDHNDISHFLNFNKVTDYPAVLTNLRYFNKDVQLSQGESAITALTLTDEATPPFFNIPVEYQATGVLHPNVQDVTTDERPLHLVMVAGFFSQKLKELSEERKKYLEASTAAAQKPIFDPNKANDLVGNILIV